MNALTIKREVLFLLFKFKTIVDYTHILLKFSKLDLKKSIIEWNLGCKYVNKFINYWDFY